MKKGRRDNQCRIATCFCQRNNEMKNNDCLRIHNLIKKLTITLFIIFPMICSAQKKELLIIGTMHTVPNIVKNAYRPLLKYAIDYAPEAIYVEYIQARDTISLKNHTPQFLRQSDSIQRECSIDEVSFRLLRKKKLTELNNEEYHLLAMSYLAQRDKANYSYYNYLATYGIEGCKEPKKNESEDLSFKLAIRMGITELYSIDNHQTDKLYYEAWDKAITDGKINGNTNILNELIKTNNKQRILPSFFGNLGKYTNRTEVLQRYYLMNSFRFAPYVNEYTQAVAKYWDERNLQIALNISEQIKEKPYIKNILIVGAGHVISLQKALNVIYPDLQVKLMSE